jgi:chromosomal replication initiator protein
MDDKSYAMWVKPLKFLGAGKTTISLGCPNKFSRDWLKENYELLLHSELAKTGLNGHKLVFKVLSPKDLGTPPKGGNGNGKQLILPHMPEKMRAGVKYLNARFNFENFVVGESNEFAYSVSKALANECRCPYNCLFLLAKTGLGKSHLIQAIGNTILKKRPSARVFYVTTEDFTNEMICALRNNQIEEFKNKYRRLCDVLLLEELHFLSGKEKTQIELGYTLDSLFNDQKMVILSSPLVPEEIPHMKKMLTSRFTSGVMTTIEKPGFQTRLEILKQKAKEQQIALPNDVATFLAEHITEDVRYLEGSLVSLKAISFFLKKKITIDLAKDAVKRLMPAKKIATIDDIQKVVCKYFKIDTEVLISKSRKKIISYPRSLAIYLCRKYTDKSLEFIGRCFNRNHSTVLYEDEKIKKDITIDETVRKEVEFLCRQIEDKVA